MDIYTVLSLFLIWMEVWGSLYFFETFLQGRKIGKLWKYRQFIWFSLLAILAFSAKWIGWWRVIPVILTEMFLCLLFYQIPLWQSLFFSLLNYCLMIMMEYLSLLVLDQRWLLPTRIDEDGLWYCLVPLIAKMLWIGLLLLVRKIRRKRENDNLLTNKEWLKLSIIPIITLSAIIAMLYSYSYVIDEHIQKVYLLMVMGMAAINLVVIHIMQEILEKEKHSG